MLALAKLETEMVEFVREVAEELLRLNNSTTTLDIRKSCMARKPKILWEQDFVSACMREFYDNQNIKNLDYKDNGVYRIYFTSQPKVEHDLTRFMAVGLLTMLANKVENCSISFVKKDGSDRVMNVAFQKDGFFISSSDYMAVLDVDDNYQFKQINLHTIYKIETDQAVYNVVDK